MTLFRILIVFLLLLPGKRFLLSQGEADIWVWGRDRSDDSTTLMEGTTLIDFNPDRATFQYVPSLTLDYYVTNAAIADKYGNFLLSTNGMEIRDFMDRHVSDTIARIGDGAYWDMWQEYNPETARYYTGGFYIDNAAFFLPVPSMENQYSLIYHYSESESIPITVQRPVTILEARVKLSRETEPELLYQDSILMEGKFCFGRFSACRHANGRDWWILIPDKDPSLYHFLLFDPSGIKYSHTQDVGDMVAEGAGLAWFSEDGSKFIRNDEYSASEGGYALVFDFDRCNGHLSHLASLPMTPGAQFGAYAISPNGRFLYVGEKLIELYQYDLHEEDIENSKTLIAEYDGFIDDTYLQDLPTMFGKFIPGPDGRIYGISPTVGSRFLHVINRPNEKGTNCHFVQHQIMMPTYNQRSVPTNANQRLGPLDGSECDTLGIDNIPVAKWRYELESWADPFRYYFTDRSYFNPEQWHWDFDDGSTSNEQHPLHTFESTGQYHVCLTVSNENASDSSCQTINVVVSSTEDQESPDRVRIFPNPVEDYLEIQLPRQEVFTLQLSTIDGRVLLAPEMTCPCRINLSSFDPGVYILTLLQDGQVVRTEKVVKL